MTLYPFACRIGITLAQLDPSAKAPWTRTMFLIPGADAGAGAEPAAAARADSAIAAMAAAWTRVPFPLRTDVIEILPFVGSDIAERAPLPATARMASANAFGASCGRLCPTPPPTSRCVYGPENLFAYEAGSGCDAPLASPSSVMVGTVMTGAAARRFSRSAYLGSPSASPSLQR